GGTGVYDPEILDDVREARGATPNGHVTVNLRRFEGLEVAVLARHGRGHQELPPRLHDRAATSAPTLPARELAIDTHAVGTPRERYAPGHFVLPDQFLDFTHGRPATFFEGGEAGVYHVDVTEPYCPQVRRVLHETGRPLGLTVHDGAVYVCTQGPRFETPAEIRMFERLGGDLGGMTSVPEVVRGDGRASCRDGLDG